MSTARTPVGGDAPDDGFDERPDGSLDADRSDHDTTDETVTEDLPSDVAVGEDPLVVELESEVDEPDEDDDGGAEPAADTEEHRVLGDELDAELEAEAAEMAPLVELPDRPHFAPDQRSAPEAARAAPYRGDEISVRVRGHGRVPARRVRRVIRRVDPLSVLKLSFFFNLCVFAMFLVAAVLLWSAAIGSGSTDNIESFLIDIGFEDFRLVGTDLFRGFVVFGGGLVIAFTVFAVLLALLFNLISDVVGGIRLTVIEPLLDDADGGSRGARAE